jgi:hypothetical protein
MIAKETLEKARLKYGYGRTNYNITRPQSR